MATFTIVFKNMFDEESDVGLNDYPIFEESHREFLNQKIIDHYSNQEIGLETPGMFRLAMRRRMNEIMPKYNELYKAKALNLNPMLTFSTTALNDSASDAHTTTTGNENGSSTSDQESKGRAVSSTFPQSQLSESGDYAESATDNAGTGKATTTNTGLSEQSGDTHSSGTVSSSSEGFNGRSVTSMIAEIRDEFTNIDLDIINELQDLFMGLWDNGDSYFGNNRYIPTFGFGYGY